MYLSSGENCHDNHRSGLKGFALHPHKALDWVSVGGSEVLSLMILPVAVFTTCGVKVNAPHVELLVGEPSADN